MKTLRLASVVGIFAFSFAANAASNYFQYKSIPSSATTVRVGNMITNITRTPNVSTTEQWAFALETQGNGRPMLFGIAKLPGGQLGYKNAEYGKITATSGLSAEGSVRVVGYWQWQSGTCNGGSSTAVYRFVSDKGWPTAPVAYPGYSKNTSGTTTVVPTIAPPATKSDWVSSSYATNITLYFTAPGSIALGAAEHWDDASFTYKDASQATRYERGVCATSTGSQTSVSVGT